MKHATAAFAAALLLAPSIAHTQERDRPPEVKMLTPAECALISKRGENEFYIKGPVDIGNATYEESVIPRNGASFNGVDTFEVIARSCFVGKPL